MSNTSNPETRLEGNMTKIEKLNKAQEAMIPLVRDEWLGVGFSTSPTDRAEAEGGVRQSYEAAGLAPPKIFVWLRSPMEGAIGSAFLAHLPAPPSAARDQVWAQVWAQVWDQVWAQVWAQVWDQVGDQVGAQVRAQVWAQVGDQVGAQVWAQVGDQVGAQVRDQVWDQVGAQVGAQVWDQVGAQVGRAIYGSHEAGWLSFYAFFQRACGLAIEKMVGLQRVARAAGWWWPFRGAVLLTERPTKLERDDRGRLHCEDGPAILYSDGWGVWAIHGVRVPRKIVEAPSELTIDEIRSEKNAEIKRIARERFGEARYLQAIGAKVIDMDSIAVEQKPGAPEIVRALMEDDEKRRFLIGSDGSTRRTYYMEVDAKVASCREAHSFLCGFDERRIVAQS